MPAASAPATEAWLARFADVRLDPANVIRASFRVQEHRGMVPVVVGPADRRKRLTVAPRLRVSR